MGRGTVDNAMQQMLNLWETHPGTYTDSLGMIDAVISPCKFEPESMMKPLLLTRNQAVEVNTKVLRAGDSRVHVSTAARLKGATIKNNALAAEIEYPKGETSYAVIAGLKQATVYADHQALRPADDLDTVAEGCQYTEGGLLLLKLRHDEPIVKLRMATK